MDKEVKQKVLAALMKMLDDDAVSEMKSRKSKSMPDEELEDVEDVLPEDCEDDMKPVKGAKVEIVATGKAATDLKKRLANLGLK